AILRLLFLACLVLSSAAHAQVAPEDARRTLDILQDPAKREELIKNLQAIAQAQPPAAPDTIEPDSVGAEVLMGASRSLGHLSRRVVQAAGAVQSIPLLWGWVMVMATNDWARDMLLDAAWRLVVVLAIGLAVEWGTSRLVHRPIVALIRRAPNGNGGAPEEE